MTYLQKYHETHGTEIPEDELVRLHCPAEYFGIPKGRCREVSSGELEAVKITEETEAKCRECWNRSYEEPDFQEKNFPMAFATKCRPVMEKPFMLELLKRMEHQPLGKQKLAARIALDILESEQFLEAYPNTRDPERIKNVLTRVLTKNRVSTEEGRKILRELSESYEEI